MPGRTPLRKPPNDTALASDGDDGAHVPERTCILTREHGAREDLIRLALGPDRMDAPDLLSAIARAGRGEPLTPIERVKIDAYVMYSDHTWEGLYLQYLDGQIDKDLWDADRAQAQLLNNHPVFRAVWNARRMWFTPRYRAFRDAEFASGTGELLNWDYFKALEKPQPSAPAPATPMLAAPAK